MRSFPFFSMMLAVVLAASFNLFADAVLDDCEGGTNQNKFGCYWYFYDDSKDGGNSSIPGVGKAANGDYNVVPSATAGHAGLGIALPYILGPKKAGTGSGYNYIGMGTQLCASGKVLDISAATTCTFWLKCDKTITVEFMLIDTVNVTDNGNYEYLCTITAANTWQQFIVPLNTGIGGVLQPSWAKQATFSLKTISKFNWQIHNSHVGTDTSGTLDIDDIALVGFTYVPPDLCLTCAGAAGQTPSPAALLSNFEAPALGQNARGYFWYCYTDEKGRPAGYLPSEVSAITGGADLTTIPPTLTLGSTWPKGFGGTNGADIQFTLGKKYPKNPPADSTFIKPFVGIGTALYNENSNSDIYNATADGMTGIYFDYTLNASDSTTVLQLEVSSLQDVGDTSARFYIDVPSTGAGVWKSATVPFSKFTLPDWKNVTQGTPLDATKLERIQFKVQGNVNLTGEVGIDNVYLVGGTKITSSIPIRYRANTFRAVNGFASSLANNHLKVTFNRGMTNGAISLVNTQGALVARNAAAKNLVADVGVAGLAKGVYMLNVKADTKTGAGYNRTMPVTIY